MVVVVAAAVAGGDFSPLPLPCMLLMMVVILQLTRSCFVLFLWRRRWWRRTTGVRRLANFGVKLRS